MSYLHVYVSSAGAGYLVGALVKVTHLATGTVEQGLVGPSGYANISLLMAPDYYDVDLSFSGYVSKHLEAQYLTGDDVYYTLSSTWVVVVTANVTEATTHAPIIGAAVTYTRSDGYSYPTLNTISSGNATFHLETGTYSVFISAGSQFDTYSGLESITASATIPYTLNAVSPFDVPFTVYVKNLVTNAVVSGASVTITNAGTGTVYGPYTSDGIGSVTHSVPYGTYTVTASKSGFQTNTDTGITIISPVISVSHTIKLLPIGGAVTEIIKVSDSIDGRAVADAAVSVSPGWGEVTDSEGAVTLTPFTPGYYTVTVTKPGYRTTTWTSVSLTGAETKVFPLHPTRFTVSVTSLSTGLTVTGATVNLTLYGATVAHGATGTDGKIVFYRLVVASGYVVSVTKTGYTPYNNAAYTLADDATLNVALASTVYQVYVRDYSTFAVIPGATVNFVENDDDNTVFTEVTDATGTAVFTTITSDVYTLTVTATGYKPYENSAFTVVVQYTDGILLIPTNPSTHYTITFKDASTRAVLPGVAVQMYLIESPYYSYSATSDGDGVALIDGFFYLLKNYQLFASLTGYVTLHISSLAAKNDTAVTLYLSITTAPVAPSYDEWATQTTTIGGKNVSDYVIDANWRREDHFYQSRVELKILNIDRYWTNRFSPNDEVRITVNGESMFVGEVEDGEDSIQEGFVSYDILTVTGVGTEYPLHRIYITKNYPTATVTTSDDVIENSLNEGQSLIIGTPPIIYNSPGSAPEATVKFNRSYLADKYREICENNQYSGYVDNDYILKYFPEGSVFSGTQLIHNDSDNRNVIDISCGAYAAYKVRNYVEVYGRSVRDHWTDSAHYSIYNFVSKSFEDTNSWDDEVNCVDWGDGDYIYEEYIKKLPFGICSLGFQPDDLGALHSDVDFAVKMSFPICNYSFLNLGLMGTGSFWVYWLYRLVDDLIHTRPRLTDRHGNEAEYHYERGTKYETENGPTELVSCYPNSWRKVEFPYGAGTPVDDNESLTGANWFYITKMGEMSVENGDFTSISIDADDETGHCKITFTWLDMVNDPFPLMNWTVGMTITLSGTAGGLDDGVFNIMEIGEDYIRLDEVLAIDTNAAGIALVGGFDWTQIVKFAIYCKYSNNYSEAPTVFIDDLELPTVQPISIYGDAASQTTYGLRMYKEYHSELANQRMLDDLAYQLLVTGRNPVQSLHIWADGQTSSKYAGETVQVTSDKFGLSNESYRVVKLHHILSSSHGLRVGLGYNWVTEYELVRNSVGEEALTVSHAAVDALRRFEVVTLDKLLDLTEMLTEDEVNAEVQTYQH